MLRLETLAGRTSVALPTLAYPGNIGATLSRGCDRAPRLKARPDATMFDDKTRARMRLSPQSCGYENAPALLAVPNLNVPAK